MQLKEYNLIQTKIIKKYNLECLVVNDSVKFFSIMSAFSAYRQNTICYSTLKAMIKIVKNK